MTLRKVYRFRMRPTVVQAQALMRQACDRRFVWNWALARRNEHYKANGKGIGRKQLSAELTMLRNAPGFSWLRETSSASGQQALADLDQAFAAFFKKIVRFPKFKSRKNDTPKFRIPQRAKVANSKVFVPKIGWIRIRQSQSIDGVTKSATFKRRPDGHWYVTLVSEFEMPDVSLPDPKNIVGIDLGLTTFAVMSDGSEVTSPKFFRKAQAKLRRAQRVLSRRKKGSKRRAKAKLKVVKIHQDISNKRSDFLHKLTTSLVRNHDAIIIENLGLKGLMRTKLSKSFGDASMGEFRRQLTYKCLWNRKHLVVIDMWFPSSKMCRSCKRVNSALTLADRVWTCECGVMHKRDPNAAGNILDEGVRILAAGHAESQNARGADVRPAKAG